MAGTSTTKSSEDGSSKPDTAPTDPTTADVVAEAESTGLVTLAEDNGDHGVVFEANRKETAKIKDEPEPDLSKHVEIKIVSPHVDSFTATLDDGKDGNVQYVITSAGSLVPGDVETKIIEQAASQGVAVTAKVASK